MVRAMTTPPSLDAYFMDSVTSLLALPNVTDKVVGSAAHTVWGEIEAASAV
jgi:hypothetical protein